MSNNPKEHAEEEEEELETGSSLAESAWTTTSTTKAFSSSSSSSITKSNTFTTSPFQKISNLRTSLSTDLISPTSITSPYTLTPLGSTPIIPLQLPLVYCDQTASNRPLSSIESYLQKECYPYYGNTHTNTSVTGSQSTAFVAEARQIVAEGVGASITGKAARDVVLFSGSGTTSVVDLLIDVLNLKTLSSTLPPDQRPIVFIGPYEHHSNLLPWRETGCEIVMIPPSSNGVSLEVLENILKKYSVGEYKERMKMATFTAASNVTGLVPNISAITDLLSSYNVLSFWDYATGAPYLPLSMSSTTSAIFFSPHKMLGGINTPGVLVIKKHLINQINPPNKKGGGGTVFYVTQTHHRFLSNRIERYEGGTPDIVGIWRIGMVFLKKREVEMEYKDIALGQREVIQKKKVVGGVRLPSTLVEYEYQSYNKIAARLRKNAPNLILLGSTTSSPKGANHLPIFSFLIKCSKRFLHYNYVSALLNDLFGIQSRGGCQCSGPYSQRLLGLTTTSLCCDSEEEVPNEANQEIEAALLNHKDKSELLRPGYTRLSLPFKGLTEEEVDYVIQAMEWVAKYGWMMMCFYRCNHRTGEWRHWSRQGKPLGRTERRWLSHYNTFTGSKQNENDAKPKLPLKEQLNQTLQNASLVLERTKSDPRFISEALSMHSEDGILGDGDVGERLEKLRWYVYPQECARWLKDETIGDIPPDTMGDEILGAIRPLGYEINNEEEEDTMKMDIAEKETDNEKDFATIENKTDKDVPTVEDMAVDDGKSSSSVITNNRKRKMNENLDDAKKKKNPSTSPAYSSSSQVHSSSKISNTTISTGEEETKEYDQKHLSEKQNIESKVYAFRDGEHHTGEASIQEIEDGYNDGEISENCQIYSLEEEEWIDVELFLKRLKQKGEKMNDGKDVTALTKKHEEEMEEEKKMSNDDDLMGGAKRKTEEDAIEEEKVVEPTSSKEVKMEATANLSKPISFTPKVIVESARAKKKPARDSSTWGQSTCPTHLPTAKSETDKKEEKELGDGKEDVSASAKAVINDETVNTQKDAVMDDQTCTTATPTSPSKVDVSHALSTSSTATQSTSPNNNRITRKNGKRLKPPPKMMRYITQAMIQWNMVEENDRLLLGLSGGKDSLSLLHCLIEFQRKLPINFTIEVCTIDPMTPSFDPSPLIPYVESLGLKYHYIRDDIVSRANTAGKDGKVVSSLCSFCARMKRGNLYTCARENKCNKLVLAQHLDDCAESFLMSVMHNGFIRTMKAHYQINAGDISVIRPMVYCRESLMTDFAKSANLPVINENCPACFEEPKERARVKKLLSREETLYPNLFDNLRRSLIPLMHDDATSIMRCYLEETLAKSRKNETKKHKKKNRPTKNHKEGRGRENVDDDAVSRIADTSESKEEKADAKQENMKLSTDQESGVGSTVKHDNNNDKVECSRAKSLADASEEEIIAELARRRAERYRLSGAMKHLGSSKAGGDDEDPTGQVCTLNGGNGSIPCRELME